MMIGTELDKAYSDLLNAIMIGDLEVITHLLLVFPADFINDRAVQPLDIAIICGHGHIVKFLLENGFNPNRLDKAHCCRALKSACMTDGTAITELLLKFGADPNAQLLCNGTKAIHYACFMGRQDLVNLYLKYKCNVHIADKLGRTPLQIAIKRGHENIVSILLKQGVSIGLRFGDVEINALQFAVCERRTNVVNIILQHVCESKTKARDALRGEWKDLVLIKDILMRHDNLNFETMYGYSLIHLAIKVRHYKIINMLLEKGVPFEVSDEKFPVVSRIFALMKHRQRTPLLLHVIKMTVAGMSVSDNIRRLIRENEEARNLYTELFTKKSNEYKCQVNLLKETAIFTSLTYYDILNMDPDDLACYVKNEKVMGIMKDRSYNVFSHYRMFIERQFQKAVKRRILLDRSLETICDLMNLPYTLTRCIAQYLSDQDLERLASLADRV